MKRPVICIFHKNCVDGFGSAWVVRKALGDQVEFHEGVYSEPTPNVVGKDVYLVDFSYERSVVETMIESANSVTILDHHSSAIKDLEGLRVGSKTLYGVLDPTRSGAMITWDYFFPNQEPPQLLKHIQDRDLWKFNLPATREIQAALFSYPYSFEDWDKLMQPEEIPQLIVDGIAIERKHHKDIEELLPQVTRKMNICGYIVPIANVPYMMGSDAGDTLCKGEPFAGYYYDTPTLRVFGLRSDENGINVGEFAKKNFSGGGHDKASGFKVSHEIARTFEVDESKI